MKNTILKWLTSIITLIIALIPVWFFLLLKSALNPNGFWQNFVVYGVGIYFLGAFQIIFLIVWIAFIIGVVLDM